MRFLATSILLALLLPHSGAWALTALCSGSLGGNGANLPATTIFTGTSPCPAASVTATLSNVGSGVGVDGKAISYAWTSQPYANTLTLTSSTALKVGLRGSRTITFSQAVQDPYLLVGSLPAGVTYTFDQAFQLVGINRATVNTNKIISNNTATGAINEGFSIHFPGTLQQLSFSTTGTGAVATTVALPSQAATEVPGPLPLLGLAAAFRASRRLRRRVLRERGDAANGSCVAVAAAPVFRSTTEDTPC